jgi:hypothetical protein
MSLFDEVERRIFPLKIYFKACLKESRFVLSSQRTEITIDKKMYPRKTRFLGSLKCSKIFERKSIIQDL